MLYGKRPPYNLYYHIKDVWDYVDSVRERNNLPDTVKYSMRWRVQPPLTDTLLSLSVVLHRCVERGVADEKIYMELARIYMALGRYDDAYSVISPDVKPSRAALWYAVLALCEENRNRAVFYKERIDLDWAVSNYPDVMAGIDTMCVSLPDYKNKYVLVVDTARIDGVDAASVILFKRKYKEVYELYTAGQYSAAQSVIEDILKDGGLMVDDKAKFHLLLALCRGRLYGKESMVRSMRAVRSLYVGTRQGDFARKVLDVYDK
ncbi:MAG: hypothetical protein IKT29_07105 [Flavobacteriales bacterium]|nr:hypothetical protein [Flavobacteriales bacterium]